MKRSNAAVAGTMAVAAGAGLWILGSAMTDRREAWNSGTYWAIFYPAAIAVCGFLGYLFSERPWRWCLALFAAQFVTMTLLANEIGSPAPLGLILFGVLSVPAIGAAHVAAGMRRRRSD